MSKIENAAYYALTAIPLIGNLVSAFVQIKVKKLSEALKQEDLSGGEPMGFSGRVRVIGECLVYLAYS
jgi:hypothetical protein